MTIAFRMAEALSGRWRAIRSVARSSRPLLRTLELSIRMSMVQTMGVRLLRLCQCSRSTVLRIVLSSMVAVRVMVVRSLRSQIGSRGGLYATDARARPKRLWRRELCIAIPGLVVGSRACCSTTRSIRWVSQRRKIMLELTDGAKGHCWADTEGNVSQLTVPQGPTVVRASEIVMKFFDSMA
jgi:hypothetical protein